MNKWKWVTLDKLGLLENGMSLSVKMINFEALFKGKNIPFIDGSDISRSKLWLLKNGRYCNFKRFSNKAKLFPKNTVCIVRCGTSGDSALLKASSCLSDKVYGFNSFKEISNPKFIKYCFDFPIIKEKIVSLSKSSTAQPVLSFQKLRIVKFPLPPFVIQQKIGNILSAYDELTENNERQIELLEALRTYFYKKLLLNNFQNNWKRLKLEEMATIIKGTKPASHALQNQYIYIYMVKMYILFLLVLLKLKNLQLFLMTCQQY
ncbi:restriction endonuclease subunit S [Mycoplasma parvum]|uniref:Type I restriction modification DNA specificity domain-containing protein n=1 Tax=Mycoplasma parvum str. Indiana TaxID=1403316 RepID=U5NC49_9MOLU|nr:restriction endonuclease subunit S [Mycoplasma parvum]AGX89151.1 hypothetical protein PRV_02065 [Mycoplasma parvum str. Indiana]